MELVLERFRYLSRHKNGGEDITISRLKDIWVLEFEIPYEYLEVHYYDDYSDMMNKVAEITDCWHNVWEGGQKITIDLGETNEN